MLRRGFATLGAVLAVSACISLRSPAGRECDLELGFGCLDGRVCGPEGLCVEPDAGRLEGVDGGDAGGGPALDAGSKDGGQPDAGPVDAGSWQQVLYEDWEAMTTGVFWTVGQTKGDWTVRRISGSGSVQVQDVGGPYAKVLVLTADDSSLEVGASFPATGTFVARFPVELTFTDPTSFVWLLAETNGLGQTGYLVDLSSGGWILSYSSGGTETSLGSGSWPAVTTSRSVDLELQVSATTITLKDGAEVLVTTSRGSRPARIEGLGVSLSDKPLTMRLMEVSIGDFR